MPVYVAMLRGINVGPHKRIKMERLRASFEAMGFERVQTYIQSGNVVFKSGKISTEALSKKIEEKLSADFGFAIPVVSRTADEMSAAVKNNPFLRERGIDVEKLHVMFLSDTPSPAGLKKLAEVTTPPEQARCPAKEIYLYLPNGVAESGLMKANLERILGVVPTARNWKTVKELARMCGGCG